MEDRRIKKTKRILKETLISMLTKKPLDRITVTELCSQADVSRITFYTHYDDKFSLIDEIVQDLIESARAEFMALQQLNNPNRDGITAYLNLLDCILNLYIKNPGFLGHADSDSNPYIFYSLFRCVSENVADHIQRESFGLPPRYPPKVIASFLCHGLWGFISSLHDQGMSLEEAREEVKPLLEGILSSGVLTKSV